MKDEIICYNHYVYTKKLGIDYNIIRPSCDIMEKFIKENFMNQPDSFTGQSTMITGLFSKYNLLMYSFPGFHKLYESIRKTFRQINDAGGEHYIQCWLNYYYKGDFIKWHHHWSYPRYENCWHGFYCVDCEEVNSYTRYKLKDINEEFDIKSENDLIILSKSERDEHRTFPWEGEKPRITIAFDIVSNEYIDNHIWKNHWIPI